MLFFLLVCLQTTSRCTRAHVDVMGLSTIMDWIVTGHSSQNEPLWMILKLSCLYKKKREWHMQTAFQLFLAVTVNCNCQFV